MQFYEYGHFPGVIGCIDGCHVPIKCPSTPNAEEYRNRKNCFSINVHGVCTPNLEFSNIVARWKGATHDSMIFLNSSLCAQFERGQHSGLLLGDSAYGQSNYLFTPHLNPTTAEQQRYNRASTRGMIERMFGVRKTRFQCLRNTLRFKPRRCCKVIIATAVLHNYLKQHGCPDLLMEDQDDADPWWQRQPMTSEDLHTELLSQCSTSAFKYGMYSLWYSFACILFLYKITIM